MDNSKSFHYTYNAGEQEEIKKIREKYAPKNESKIQLLRRLDAGVTKKATVISLIFGVVGALIMGTGMSLIMSDFSKILGIYQPLALLVGFITGLIGTVLICLAYPIYNSTVKKERQRIAPEILRLTDELMES